MKEYQHIVKTENEAKKVIGSLKAAGYRRVQNCYWVEWFEKNVDGIIHRHIVERDF